MHEQIMKGHKDLIEEHALKISNAERGARRGIWIFNTRCRGRGRQRREFVECYKYHKLGHFQSEYPRWEKNANYVELNDEEEMILIA